MCVNLFYITSYSLVSPIEGQAVLHSDEVEVAQSDEGW